MYRVSQKKGALIEMAITDFSSKVGVFWKNQHRYFRMGKKNLKKVVNCQYPSKKGSKFYALNL